MQYENLESFNPSVCISGKVLRLSRITANVFRKYLKPFNVTDSQLNILFVLSKKGDLNQKQLADITRLEKSSLNRNLNRLFDRKLLSKKDFPMISITDRGMAFVNGIIPEWRKAMEEIRTLLGDEGEGALNLVHTKLLDNK